MHKLRVHVSKSAVVVAAAALLLAVACPALLFAQFGAPALVALVLVMVVIVLGLRFFMRVSE